MWYYLFIVDLDLWIRSPKALRLETVLNDFGGTFRVIVLLQDKFVANHTPPRWCSMMDKYLPVFLSIESTINPDPKSNSICSPACSRKLPYASLLPADAHYDPTLQPFDKQSAFCYSQIFQIFTHLTTLAAIFLQPSLHDCVLTGVWPCLHICGIVFLAPSLP